MSTEAVGERVGRGDAVEGRAGDLALLERRLGEIDAPEVDSGVAFRTRRSSVDALTVAERWSSAGLLVSNSSHRLDRPYGVVVDSVNVRVLL